MIKILFVILLHTALVYSMQQSKIVSTLHALAALIIGIPWALSSPRKKQERTLYLCSYITGAEVLWRMTQSFVFWEYGKYAIVLVLFLTAGKYLFSKGTAWLYLLCLLPACFITFAASSGDFVQMRKDISQNISGPLALAICYNCFSGLKISAEQYRKGILALCLSLSGVTFLCFFGLYRLGAAMKFGTESSFEASGGFGPNQVSAVLGLGALLAFLFCLDPGRKKGMRNLMILFGIWSAIQSALTFSRAGIAYALASIVLGALFFIQNSKMRNRFIFFSAIVFLLGNFVILPKLDQYTEGNLSNRFKEMNTTNRGEIALEEIEIFKDNPLFGIGIGNAKYHRSDEKTVASHTEFSRLLAEHGSFGVMAIFCLLIMTLAAVIKGKNKKAKAFAAALGSWTLFFMLGNGMRLAAPAFVFGLSVVNFLPEPGFFRPRPPNSLPPNRPARNANSSSI